MLKLTKLRRVRLVTVDSVPTDPNAPTMLCAEDAARVAKAILPTDREGFVVIHLDSRGRVRSAELAHVGTLNMTIVHAREIFKGAILANADSIIVAHNHPSGNGEPSSPDIALTKMLVKAGALLDIEVKDHLIVAAEGSVSLRARGLL